MSHIFYISSFASPWGGVWFKMIAGTMNVTAPEGFWEPIRETVLTNLFGYVSKLNERGVIVHPPQVARTKPIVTYISRQGAGRRLIEKDHDALVQALMELDSEGICEVHVVQMERLSLAEQIEIASRSTVRIVPWHLCGEPRLMNDIMGKVLVGVHGNGLTVNSSYRELSDIYLPSCLFQHQLWMPPSPLSSTIEIFIPEGTYFNETPHDYLKRQFYQDTFSTMKCLPVIEGSKYVIGLLSLSLVAY